MNELIVNFDTQTVSARELHEKLNIGTSYRDWFPRMCEYGFEENVDFNLLKKERVQFEGNREVIREIADADISIEMAKQICMIQRTPDGKRIRDYFINLEHSWNTPEQVMARALKLADKVIQEKQLEIEELKPKADFFDAVADSKTALPMGDVAKVLGTIGRNGLFKFLRDKKILMYNNIPYQEYVDRGYFRIVETKYSKPTGETVITTTTLVYQRGVDFIRKELSK